MITERPYPWPTDSQRIKTSHVRCSGSLLRMQNQEPYTHIGACVSCHRSTIDKALLFTDQRVGPRAIYMRLGIVEYVRPDIPLVIPKKDAFLPKGMKHMFCADLPCNNDVLVSSLLEIESRTHVTL